MTQPQIVWLVLSGIILAGAVGAVAWGMLSARRKEAAKSVKAVAAKPNAKAKPSGAPAKAAPARPPKLTEKQLSAVERRFSAAKKTFSKSMDKRIAREPIIGEPLRRTRDMVIGWYEQGGKVERVRYHAGDARSACKVCQGRNGKEYDLLKTDVVVRILPPSHPDVGGKKECNCRVTPVMALR